MSPIPPFLHVRILKEFQNAMLQSFIHHPALTSSLPTGSCQGRLELVSKFKETSARWLLPPQQFSTYGAHPNHLSLIPPLFVRPLQIPAVERILAHVGL